MTTIRKFNQFIAEGEPGQQFVYYVGDLATDCANAGNQRAADIRKAAADACSSGRVLLTQRRRAESIFEYIAIIATPPKAPRR